MDDKLSRPAAKDLQALPYDLDELPPETSHRRSTSFFHEPGYLGPDDSTTDVRPDGKRRRLPDQQEPRG